MSCTNMRKQPSKEEKRCLSHEELAFCEEVMFAAGLTMSRMERLYILLRQTVDPEDLELILASYKGAEYIRDVVRDHLEKRKAARTGDRSEPPKEKRKR